MRRLRPVRELVCGGLPADAWTSGGWSPCAASRALLTTDGELAQLRLRTPEEVALEAARRLKAWHALLLFPTVVIFWAEKSLDVVNIVILSF